MLRDKAASGRRDEYIKSLRHYIGRFLRGRLKKQLVEIEVEDVERYLKQFKGNSRATHINRISALFAWGIKKGHCSENPCDRIERPKIDRKPPRILTPDEVDKLLAACPLKCKPGFVLALFCGIRPAEVMRLTWADINLEAGTVTINAAASKVRSRRVQEIPARALALLLAHPHKLGSISPSHSTCRRWNRKARGIIKFWQADILRHTAASYHLAHVGDAGKVATALGNSAKILLTHYNGLASKSDAEAFFRL